jgi:hypothetical protein
VAPAHEQDRRACLSRHRLGPHGNREASQALYTPSTRAASRSRAWRSTHALSARTSPGAPSRTRRVWAATPSVARRSIPEAVASMRSATTFESPMRFSRGSPYLSHRMRNRPVRSGGWGQPCLAQPRSSERGTNCHAACARSHTGGAGDARSQSRNATGLPSRKTVFLRERSLWQMTFLLPWSDS